MTVKNGDVFSGIFCGAAMEINESNYLLKMVQKIKSGVKTEANTGPELLNEYTGVGEDHAMSFDLKDVIDLAVEGATFDGRDKSQNGLFLLPAFLPPASCLIQVSLQVSGPTQIFQET